MASPVDAGRNSTAGVSSANKACNLPASIAAGDLLIVALRVAQADTHSLPAGWDWLVQNHADAVADTTSIIYRTADGAEGATVTINGTAALKFASVSWRITGWGGTPEISAVATANSTTPNPTTVTPTGGSKDYLFLWLAGWQNEATSPPSGNPTSYSNPVGGTSGTGGAGTSNCGVAGASRQLTAASEDPGSWTISIGDQWVAWAIAIHPAAAATKAPPPFQRHTPRVWRKTL